MQKITDTIYIGSRNDIFLDAEIIDKKTSVEVNPKNKTFKFPFVKSYLNVAKDLNINGIDLPKIGLIDGKGNSKESLKKAVNIVDELIKQYGNIMVFCHKGESRSALVVLAYLHAKRDLNIAKAYDLIRFAKSDININPFLSLMLCELSGEKYFECAEPNENPETSAPKVETKTKGQSNKKNRTGNSKKKI